MSERWLEISVRVAESELDDVQTILARWVGTNQSVEQVIRPAAAGGLSVDDLMSPAPGAAQDPIRQRGLKVIHIGFLTSAFRNSGTEGEVRVRIVDANGSAIHKGSGKL